MLSAFLFGFFPSALFFLLTHIPLRIYAGGLHFSTRIRCFIASLFIFAVVLYRINHSSYDKITSFGTMTTVKANVHEHGKSATESASGSAYYTFMVYFVDDFGNLYGSSLANLTVGNNNFSWSAT